MLPRKILFCTDFSECSSPAFRLAVEYTSAFGAKLIIAHVVDTRQFPADYLEWVGDIDSLVSRLKASADTVLKSMANECKLLTKEVKTYCRVGSPHREIISLAQEESVDLIVLGTHGRSVARHLLLGSVARSVLRLAHRPVLILEA